MNIPDTGMNTHPPQASMKELFGNHVIRTVLLSTLFLQIGIWVRNYSILLYVMEQTNENPVAVSLISVAEFAPIFIFSFVGGALADRWRPKKTMVWCDLLSALSMVAVLITLSLGSWHIIFFATLVSSILSQFSQPAGMKLFKLRISDSLMQMTMSLYQTLFAVFMILGPMLGTLVFEQYGMNAALVVTGIAFILSSAVLLLLPADRAEDKGTSGGSLGREMIDGIRYVLGKRSLTLLGGSFAAAGLGMGLIHPLAIFLVTERLDLPKEYFQWLMTANGVGMIVGGAVTMMLSKRIRPQVLLIAGMTAITVTTAVIAYSTELWVTLPLEFFSGMLFPSLHIGISTLIFKNTDAAYIGRVNGTLNPLFMGAMVVTMSMSGWLKEIFSLIAIFQTAAVLFLIGVLFIVPMLRDRDDTGVQQPVVEAS